MRDPGVGPSPELPQVAYRLCNRDRLCNPRAGAAAASERTSVTRLCRSRADRRTITAPPPFSSLLALRSNVDAPLPTAWLAVLPATCFLPAGLPTAFTCCCCCAGLQMRPLGRGGSGLGHQVPATQMRPGRTRATSATHRFSGLQGSAAQGVSSSRCPRARASHTRAFRRWRQHPPANEGDMQAAAWAAVTHHGMPPDGLVQNVDRFARLG
jgi:hypothetical protein